MQTVYAQFLKQASETPDSIAVVDEHGAVTYRELVELSNAIEQLLPAQSRFVGIIMDHGAEMIASMLAVLKNGAAYVPAEPDFPPERIAFMLSECSADAVITQEKYAHLAGPEAQVILIEPGARSAGDMIEACADDIFADTGKAKPDDLAYVLYTSGTTGKPKGVSVENRNLCSYVQAFQDEFHPAPGDKMLQHSVCSFDIFVEEVFTTLLSGATLMIPPKAVRDDVVKLISYINDNGVTMVDGFPYLMDDINSQDSRPNTVRLYVSGGDVLHASQVSKLVNEAVVYNTYGPSETTCCVSYFNCTSDNASDNGTYPVGHPILGTRIDIVDENLQPVPQGEIGEMLITGPGVSRGYLGTHPEQANFHEDDDGTRRYQSGDMGYYDENCNLIFLHRKDDQVMIEGKRVESKEVENVLLQDDAVHQAVVVPGRDDAGFSFLVAYIVPANVDDFSIGELKERLALHLTPFMIPEFFIQIKSIPLNSHGKPAVEELPVMLKEHTR